MPRAIALLAHDSQRDGLAVLLQQSSPVFSRYRLLAPEPLGQYIRQTTGLLVEEVAPVSLGGDIQLAARLVTDEFAAVICLSDATSPAVSSPEAQTFMRLCQIYDVPLATNLATVEAIITHLAQTRLAYLIFNPIAGQGNAEQDLDLIRQLLEPHLNLQVHYTTPEISAAQLAQDAAAANVDLVIASGGDGTVSAVAGALIETGIPLGVIPRGTANAFCLALGIPSAIAPIRRACQVILSGKARQIDAARCNGLPLVLLAGIGYEAAAVDKASRDMKDRWGPLAYFIAGWQQLDEQEAFFTNLDVDGESYQLNAGAITIANAAPPTSVMAQGAGTVIFDDGLLDVTIAVPSQMVQPAMRKLQTIRGMVQMMGAALVNVSPELEGVFHFHASRIKMTTSKPQKMVLDGEVMEVSSLEIECIPGGLTVIMP